MSEKIDGVYLHCRRCVEAGEPNDLEVLCDGPRVQVWCRRHDVEIVIRFLAVSLFDELPTCESCGHEHGPNERHGVS